MAPVVRVTRPVGAGALALLVVVTVGSVVVLAKLNGNERPENKASVCCLLVQSRLSQLWTSCASLLSLFKLNPFDELRLEMKMKSVLRKKMGKSGPSLAGFIFLISNFFFIFLSNLTFLLT